LTDGSLLDIKLGRHFRNQLLLATVDPQNGVRLVPTGELNDFMAMTKQRSDVGSNKQLWVPNGQGGQGILSSGLELSNVGISLALTTTIDGKNYAVLARRRLADGSNKIMLISGYVDAAKFCQPESDKLLSPGAAVVANTAAEAAEEINMLQMPGWFARTEVRGAMIRDIADELRFGVGRQVHSVSEVDQPLLLTGGHDVLDYSPNLWWKLSTCPLPNYIHNVFRPPTVTLGDVRFDDVGFQFHMHTNSGQIIVGGHLTFDLTNREFISLVHAEDGPLSDPVLKASLKEMGAPPDALATRVDRLGLLFCPLDAQGQLTPKFYNFIEGSLKPAPLNPDLEGVTISDAFVNASASGENGFCPPMEMSGFVDRADVPARTFFGI
jgi:hypothetical protein